MEHYTEFLPISRADMEARGWEQLDFVVVGGDAYVDHPSFGTAIISRLLEAEGYKVGVLAQPRYSDCEDFKRFGKPKYGFFIGGGNVDSMVSHYSVAKIPRAEDEYSPGGKGGARPDRSATVYTRLAKQAYPDLPVILGGLEAAQNDGQIRVSLLCKSGVDGGAAVGPCAALAAGGVLVLGAGDLGDRVMADHAVYVAAADEETVLRLAEPLEVLAVAVAGLGQHAHLIALGFQQAADDGGAETGVVHIGVAAHHHKVQLFPPPGLHVGPADGEKFGVMFHSYPLSLLLNSTCPARQRLF